MLKIRLKRIGRKKLPFFRLVVIESRKSAKGKEVEIVGHLNPRNKKTLILKTERIKHWLSGGAVASGAVHNLLIDAGLVKGPKIKVTKTKKVAKKEGDSAPKKII